MDSKGSGISPADRAVATLSDNYHICDSLCAVPTKPDIILCGYCWIGAKSIRKLDQHLCDKQVDSFHLRLTWPNPR